ncbi:MAG: peptidylprolyl isomerase [Mariprofundaceae bacterium]|nr:peptidylprolyl isomerase [Mariprofundaceae bacterium]
MNGILRCVIILSGFLFLHATSVYAEVVDSIAAIVNNQAITCYQVRQSTKELTQQLKQAGMQHLPPAKALQQRTLDAEITKMLQLQKAKKLRITVTAEEVNNAIAKVEASNKIPAGQLLDIIKARGMDVNRYKKTLKERLLTSKLGNTAVRSKLQVSEESMREYYRKYMEHPTPLREIQLAEIFVSLPVDPSPEQVAESRKKIKKLLSQISAGGDFERIATLYSDAPNASQGGQMGWFLPGSMPPRFTPVFSLPVGGVSLPIRSPTGFQLFTITKERWHQPRLRAEAYDQVHARHILLKLSEAMTDEERAKTRTEAEQIAEEMKNVSDKEFATRAREISQGPSATKGGDLGWFKRGVMVPAFDKAVFAMKAGETSGVVESPFGLHIIRMIERRHIDPDSFEAHRGEIQNILLNIEMQDQMPRWMAGLRAKAIIDRRSCP